MFCTVLLLSGGRISEILSLTPAAIDAESGTVTLRTLKRRKNGVARQLPLPRRVISEMSRLFGIPQTAINPVQQNRRLWPWSRTTAWRIVKGAMKAAGVEGPAASPKDCATPSVSPPFRRWCPRILSKDGLVMRLFGPPLSMRR
jgi:integrase/recombinase XerD